MRVNNWGSHVGLLYYALQATEGTVVELGMGLISTPFLHVMCCLQGINRKVVSFECMHTWFNHFHMYMNDYHEIYHDVHDRTVNKYERYPWKNVGVVLIDGGPPTSKEYFSQGYTNRVKALKFFKDIATIIILHDTNDPRMFAAPGFKDVVYSFKFCATDKTDKSGWTTALSNTFDVEKNLIPRLVNKKKQ